MRRSIASEKLYWAPFNRFELRLPGQAIIDCSASGSVDNAVAYWAPRIVNEWPDRCTPKAIRKELSEYGAWGDDELADDAQNWGRLIWIAACNIAECEPDSSEPV